MMCNCKAPISCLTESNIFICLNCRATLDHLEAGFRFRTFGYAPPGSTMEDWSRRLAATMPNPADLRNDTDGAQ